MEEVGIREEKEKTFIAHMNYILTLDSLLVKMDSQYRDANAELSFMKYRAPDSYSTIHPGCYRERGAFVTLNANLTQVYANGKASVLDNETPQWLNVFPSSEILDSFENLQPLTGIREAQRKFQDLFATCLELAIHRRKLIKLESQ